MSAASGPATTPAVCECGHSHEVRGQIMNPCPAHPSLNCPCQHYRPVAPTPAPPPVEIPAEIVKQINAFADAVAKEAREARHRTEAAMMELHDAKQSARVSLDAALAELVRENGELRKHWWLAHGYAAHGSTIPLYGDDGEMQCNACLIDFKRTPVAEIADRLWTLAARAATPAARDGQ